MRKGPLPKQRAHALSGMQSLPYPLSMTYKGMKSNYMHYFQGVNSSRSHIRMVRTPILVRITRSFAYLITSGCTPA
jgi:hypothetical protein